MQMGKAKDDLSFDKQVEADWAIFVPTGWWHNVTNTGDEPLKVYSIYAPSHHPHGTVQQTKADAEAAEAAEHRTPPPTLRRSDGSKEEGQGLQVSRTSGSRSSFAAPSVCSTSTKPSRA